MIGQQLQRHRGQQRRQGFRGRRQIQGGVHLFSQFGIALGQHRQRYPLPGFDFPDVANHFVVQPIPGGQGQGGHIAVNQGNGAVFHFSGRIALGVDVADFLEFQRALLGNGGVGPPAQEQETGIVPELPGQPLVGGQIGQQIAQEPGGLGQVMQQFPGRRVGQVAPGLAQVNRQ